ncbi:MAG: 4-hydroxyphenylpyruvate dioxygenase [Cyanobacteria bacterium HKST-UBA05]|nr:4-hydroxyphenylpyruvate dioxygenase [Cyanobacteria bacterium HKST-UBA05]
MPEIPVLGFDVIEFWVGNAKQAAHYYHHAFGFDMVAYQGPETGHRQTSSYMLRQQDICLRFTSALSPDHPVSEHVKAHGDGVKDIGFRVADVQEAYAMATDRGAKGLCAPSTEQDAHGSLTKATIATYGQTTHTFVNRQNYSGAFEPGFTPYQQATPARPTGLVRVDHVVGNLGQGELPQWVDFYETVFGFFVFRDYDETDISTDYSALISKVMANASLTIKMPLNAPAQSKGGKKSQIQEFVDYYGCPGVQHLALITSNIVETVAELRHRNVELMAVPKNYYAHVEERVGAILEPLDRLAELGIIVDLEEGEEPDSEAVQDYMLQIFTLPLQDRPTFFFEIIQRAGATGFGKGNFKALFEAIERDQAKRGNL